MASSDPAWSLHGSRLDRSFIGAAVLLVLPLAVTVILAAGYLRATHDYSTAVDDAATEVAGVLLRDFFDVVFARAGRDVGALFREPLAWSSGADSGDPSGFEAAAAQLEAVADSLAACDCARLPIRGTAVYAADSGALFGTGTTATDGWRRRIEELDLVDAAVPGRLLTAIGEDEDEPWFVYLVVARPADRAPVILLADVDLDRLGPDFLRHAFEDVIRTHDVTRGSGATGISLRIAHPNGRVLLEVGSPAEGPSYALPLFGADLGSTSMVGTRPLLARITLGPEGVAALIPGGLPRSPWPLAAASVLTALLLAGVGCLLLHRLRRFTLAREAFLATVSHELRTPLAIVLAYSETVGLERPAPESRRRAATVIARETRRMTHLVENALAFSHGRRSTATLDPREVELNAAVAEVVADFRPLADERDSRLVMIAGESVSARIDRSALRQIVNNLLENAVRHGGDGQEVRVSVARHGAWAELRIADEGPGLPAGAGARLWKPFVRLGVPSGGAGGSGTGLGLSIVRHLVELHDGTVHAANRPDRGAAFTVRFPVEQATTTAAREVAWHAS